MEEIQEALDRLASLCADRGLPMFCTIQESQTAFNTTYVHLEKSPWEKMKHMKMLHKSWRFDDFMEQVIDEARVDGHDSLVLQAMGIPKVPLRIPAYPVRRRA